MTTMRFQLEAGFEATDKKLHGTLFCQATLFELADKKLHETIIWAT